MQRRTRRVAVVTGAGAGIGQGLAGRLGSPYPRIIVTGATWVVDRGPMRSYDER